MPKPSRAFLLAAHQWDPFPATAAKAFPNVQISFGSPCLLRSLECRACCSGDAVSETLVIPECGVLEDEPAARLAQAAPAFSLVAVAADPPGRVEISGEAQILFVWDEIGIRCVHV